MSRLVLYDITLTKEPTIPRTRHGYAILRIAYGSTCPRIAVPGETTQTRYRAVYRGVDGWLLTPTNIEHEAFKPTMNQAIAGQLYTNGNVFGKPDAI